MGHRSGVSPLAGFVRSQKKPKVLSYLVRFINLTAEPPVEAARGVLTVVCVTHNSDGKLKSVEIPAELADRIKVAPAELLA